MVLLLLACEADPPPPEDPKQRMRELRDPHPGHWTSQGAMSFGHVGATATALPDGRVLIYGGFSDRAELYNPARGGKSDPAAPLAPARTEHYAALTADHQVLLAGGEVAGKADTACFLYDPTADAWSACPPLPSPRVHARAVPLDDGRVLVVGGADASGALIGETWIFDGSAWSVGPALDPPREDFTLAPGPTVVGGKAGDRWLDEVLRFAEGGWKEAGELRTPRGGAAVVPLRDNRLLVAGGRDSRGALTEVEIVGGEALPPLHEARWGANAALLPDGRVIVLGGTDAPGAPDAAGIRAAELLALGAKAWSYAANQVQAAWGQFLFPLPDGQLLLLGGMSRGKPIREFAVYSHEDEAEPSAEPPPEAAQPEGPPPEDEGPPVEEPPG